MFFSTYRLYRHIATSQHMCDINPLFSGPDLQKDAKKQNCILPILPRWRTEGSTCIFDFFNYFFLRFKSSKTHACLTYIQVVLQLTYIVCYITTYFIILVFYYLNKFRDTMTPNWCADKLIMRHDIPLMLILKLFLIMTNIWVLQFH